MPVPLALAGTGRSRAEVSSAIRYSGRTREGAGSSEEAYRGPNRQGKREALGVSVPVAWAQSRGEGF